MFLYCLRAGSYFWGRSSLFIPFHLVDSANKNGVLQQLLGKKKLTVYTAPNWMEVKPKPVALWNVMHVLWYLMTVVNLNEFICWVCTALQKNYPLMHMWDAVLQMKKWVIIATFSSLNYYLMLQCKKQNADALFKAVWLRHRTADGLHGRGGNRRDE